jgi:hypothetical protein
MKNQCELGIALGDALAAQRAQIGCGEQHAVDRASRLLRGPRDIENDLVRAALSGAATARRDWHVRQGTRDQRGTGAGASAAYVENVASMTIAETPLSRYRMCSLRGNAHTLSVPRVARIARNDHFAGLAQCRRMIRADYSSTLVVR